MIAQDLCEEKCALLCDLKQGFTPTLCDPFVALNIHVQSSAGITLRCVFWIANVMGDLYQ